MGRNSIKDIRQKEIVKMFYQVAKKEGLENTSIAKIAKVMDINPSLIMHYFKTKEELVYALVDFILDKYLLIYKVEVNNGKSLKYSLVTTINSIFSKKWNRLFDDGVFYSCYSLTFRDKKIKNMYKNLSNTLRKKLANLLDSCVNDHIIHIEDPIDTADLIYVLIDGAYYYLSMIDDKIEAETKLNNYKKEAFKLLGIEDAATFLLE
ncbi:TetR family transcriptional regulator [Olivibacter sitiensis]|uniref:TetR family transcriptional regulator n=1 Tax=Olivibacter sitiensis TaxID=376470 RepID=UPI000482F2D0|nr:TetR family transcriptional regulator [Olivibacter sitiensis]